MNMRRQLIKVLAAQEYKFYEELDVDILPMDI